jgi:transcriptional regulator with XRE-family HTH domain
VSDLSADIKAAMRLSGVPARLLARHLDVTESMVSQMLRPGHNFTVGTLERIADALGMRLIVALSPLPERGADDGR